MALHERVDLRPGSSDLHMDVDQVIMLRVLVVEDDAHQRETLRALFERCNLLPGGMRFLVWMAESIETARTMLEDIRDFNLVLVDVLMPDGNGYDLLPLIKEIVGNKAAVVMNSAHNQASLIKARDPEPV